MRQIFTLVLSIFWATSIFAQVPSPKAKVLTPVYFDESPVLKKLIQVYDPNGEVESPLKRNSALRIRSYPYAESALPKGVDPVLQRKMGTVGKSARDLNLTIDGQTNPLISPWDATGAAGPNHYIQCINNSYAIYSKAGVPIVESTPLNTIFTGLPGAETNDGDPIVMYDDQADRWFISEISKLAKRILIAVSKTNDPTGEWYRWSYQLNIFPDYAKFGVSKYSYLMAINNQDGTDEDVFAIDRFAMIAGEVAPKMVLLKNTNRPQQSFHTVMPLDTDGPFSPGGPAQFITINDDAWNSGYDELWVYDLVVDWNLPDEATFQRTQQIDVPAFSSDFGTTWDNLTQPGTTQKLDAIPTVLMNRVQHRNFGTTESLVCCHAVDVDGSDHAGIRWYELTRDNGGSWSVRQASTYAPDADSRWVASIAQNGAHEIGIGYNIVGTSTSPGIRYCGQSSEEYNLGNGVLDIAETTIVDGTGAMKLSNRWGDYANISVDPHDDHSFWFTSAYTTGDNARGSKIATWELSPSIVVADFKVDKREVTPDETVQFSDLTTGLPNLWSWEITPDTYTYVEGTYETDPNPKIQFTALGTYNIQLIVANDNSQDTILKENFIEVKSIYAEFEANFTNLTEGDSLVLTNKSKGDPTSYNWTLNGGDPNASTEMNPGTVVYLTEGVYDLNLTVEKDGLSDDEFKDDYIHVCKYCEIEFGNTMDDHISNVMIGSIDNASGSEPFEDYTNLVTELERGTSNLIEVSVTSTGSVQHAIVWVDWNKNCLFEDEGEVFDLGQTSGTAGVEVLNGYISVPDTADLTYVRMRVIELYDTDPQPCYSGVYGEGEDYTIKVVGSALPVELTSFVAYPKGEVNKLEWLTASMTNTMHFEVEKSNTSDFTAIGLVPAGGNSELEEAFSFTDKNPSLKTYYRLKIVDFDGSFEYSDIVFVQRSIGNTKITNVFPNPAMDVLNVSLVAEKDFDTTVRIVTLSGKITQMRKIHLDKGVNTIQVGTSMLPNGRYTFVVQGVNDLIHFVKAQ